MEKYVKRNQKRSSLGKSIRKKRRTIDQTRAAKRDWKDLPAELIHLISRKLNDLRSFIRCRVVCKTWLSAILLSDPPLHKLPWLVECEQKFSDGTPFKEELRFYSFVTSETGSIPITKTHHGRAYLRPGHNYLLVVDGGAMYLFNPLTNKVISLPPLPPHSTGICPIFSGEDPTRNWLWHIVFYHPDQRQLNCATFHPDRVGWKYVDNNNLSRTCYWLGLIYATQGNSTLVFDADSGKKLYTIPKPKDEPLRLENMWIVESCGAILRVSLVFKDSIVHRHLEDSTFYIYALNLEGENGQPCWVRVSSISDEMLFLDYKTGFSVKATAELQGNCIYFIAEDGTPFGINNRGSKLWRYDIGTGIVKGMPCPFERCTWFVPGLH